MWVSLITLFSSSIQPRVSLQNCKHHYFWPPIVLFCWDHPGGGGSCKATFSYYRLVLSNKRNMSTRKKCFCLRVSKSKIEVSFFKQKHDVSCF